MKRIDTWIEKAKENALKINWQSIEICAHVLMDKEDDLYTAHCLEFDIVADGKSLEEAREEILSAIVNHVSFCIASNNLENILNPAPKEYWNKFFFGSEILGEPCVFPENYAYEDVELPFLRNLIPQVRFNRVFTRPMVKSWVN